MGKCSDNNLVQLLSVDGDIFPAVVDADDRTFRPQRVNKGT